VKLDLLYLAWNRLAFTKFSYEMLLENTDWSKIERLIIHDDGSTDGTADWLSERAKEAPIPCDFTIDALRSPPAVMNRYVARSEVDWFAKIDNDIVVPPGWLEAMSGVVERNPEVEMLGMEAGRGLSLTDTWDGVYRFERGSHMGGVGLIRVDSLARRLRMVETRGRFGWTEWQHEYDPIRGWINPDLPVVSLDRVPFEPWLSLSEGYMEKDWQRPWGLYHERADYWKWWRPSSE
jgi:glycosyltransferase involved in cell wall biosynthesis